jgi:hypothetical protein
MTKPIQCRFCNKLLTETTAYGCPSCGSYVCERCWGPGGDVCVNCYETGEDGNLPHEDEEENECDEDE